MQGVRRYQNAMVNKIFSLAGKRICGGSIVVNGVEYTIDKGISVGALLLMKYIFQGLTQIPQNKEIKISVREYCRIKRGNNTEIKKGLDDNLRALHGTMIKGYEITKKYDNGEETQLIRELNDGLIDKWSYEKNQNTGECVLIVTLGDNLRDLLINSALIHDDNNIFKINIRQNPHAFYIDEFLRLNNRINKVKKNKNVVSVHSLLEHIPTLPRYKELQGTGKNLQQKIISPLLRDLEQLHRLGIIEKYEIIDSEGVQFDVDKPIRYKEFAKCKIRYNLAVSN